MAFARRVRKKGLVRRYAGLCLASFIMALGIALVTNANLGTTPITSLPYALSAIYSLSLGATTFLLNSSGGLAKNSALEGISLDASFAASGCAAVQHFY